MYGGRIAEIAPTREFLAAPRHPYSIGLLANARMRKGRLSIIPGAPPDMVRPPSGCRFHPRCSYRSDVCVERTPDVTRISPDHVAYCWNMSEVR
jgi:peptide/nickel transport system ATP-binding protein